jgi:hypothetical protein
MSRMLALAGEDIGAHYVGGLPSRAIETASLSHQGKDF